MRNHCIAVSGGNPLKVLSEAWLQVGILRTNTIAKFVRHCQVTGLPIPPTAVKGLSNMTCCVHALRRIILRTPAAYSWFNRYHNRFMVAGGNPVSRHHCKVREALPSDGVTHTPDGSKGNTQYDKEGSAPGYVTLRCGE